jgi:Ser/Thr protein kinase RdoA (MazF antagonist)
LGRVAEAALRAYSLAGARLTLIKYWLNATYRVDSERGRFALRIHRAGEKLEPLIRSEVAWLDALRADAGLAVPAAIPTLDGERVARVEAEVVPGARYCTLFKWLDGRPYLTLEHVDRAGQLLAMIHRQSETFAPSDGFTRPTWDASAFMGSTLGVDLERLPGLA